MSKKISSLLLFCMLVILAPVASAQQKLADSIMTLVLKYRQTPGYEKNTAYLNSLNELALRNTNSNPDTTIILANEVITLAAAVNDCMLTTDAQKNLGLAYNVKSEYTKALTQLAEALQTGIKCGYNKGVARIYHNTGIIYSNIGNYPEALQNYFTALKTREEIADTLGISSTINGIGAVYFVQGKYEDALKNYLRALKLAEAINYVPGIETAHANIGEVYFRQSRFAEARSSLYQALDKNKITGNEEVKAFCYYTLATVFLKEGNLKEAEEACLITKRISREVGSPEYNIRANIGLSEINIKQNDFAGALVFAK
jgi:tetratricopeptide (TPR) repeat protein